MPNNVLSGQLIKSSSVNAILAEIRRVRAKTLVPMKAGAPLPRTRISGGFGGGNGTRSPFTVAICKRRTDLGCGDFVDKFYLDVNGGSWFGNGARAHPTGNFIGECNFPASKGEDVFIMCGGWLEIGSITKSEYSCTETGDIFCICGQHIKPCQDTWAFFMYDTGSEACITHPKIFYLRSDSTQVKKILSGGGLSGTMLSIVAVNKTYTKKTQNFSPKGYEISRFTFNCARFEKSTEILRSDFWYGFGGNNGFDEDHYPLGWNELAPNIWSYSGSFAVVSGVNAKASAFGSAAISVSGDYYESGSVTGFSFNTFCFGWSYSCVGDGYARRDWACNYESVGGLFSRSELSQYNIGFGNSALNYTLVRDCKGIFDFSKVVECGGGVILRKLKTRTELSSEPVFCKELYYVSPKTKFLRLGGKNQPVVLMRQQIAVKQSSGGLQQGCGTVLHQNGDNIYFNDPFMDSASGEYAGGQGYEFYVPVGIARKTKREITCAVCVEGVVCYRTCTKDVAEVSTFTHGVVSPALFFSVANERDYAPQGWQERKFRGEFLDVAEPTDFSTMKKEIPDGKANKDKQKETAKQAVSKIGGQNLPKRTEASTGGATSVASVASAGTAQVLLSAFPEDSAEITEAQDL